MTDAGAPGRAEVPVTRAGGYDWLAIWRQMYDVERAQAEPATESPHAASADHWAGRAGRFARATDRVPQPDAFMQFVLARVRPDDTVIDVGAGAGRHATFLAQHVARVVAVEPSPAMRQHLEQRVAAEQADRVMVVATRWPEAEVPPADVAICAHVVYGVREIGPFLIGMHAAARRACFVLVGLRPPSAYIAPAWERIYGEPRAPLPGALECLNALYQLGIPAQLTLLPTSHYTFADEQEALGDMRSRLLRGGVLPSDEAVRAAMPDLLERDAAGRLAPRGQPSHAAVLWWERAALTERDGV